MPGHVGEEHVGGGVDGHRPDGQSVQAVCQVDGVAGSDDDQRDKGDEPDPQVGVEFLEEGEVQLCAEAGLEEQEYGHHPGQQDLPEHLLTGRKALGILLHHLLVVIHEADDPVADRDEERRPDILVGQVGPQQGRYDDRRQDHHAAHGGGALFLQVRFRSIGADHLAGLQALELADDPGAEHEADQQCRYHGVDGPKRQVLEDIEELDVGRQRIKYVVEHVRLSLAEICPDCLCYGFHLHAPRAFQEHEITLCGAGEDLGGDLPVGQSPDY